MDMTAAEAAWFAKSWKERKEIVEKYRDRSNRKYSFADIGKEFGISSAIIRDTYHNSKDVMGSERHQRIIALWDGGKGLSYDQISSRLGVTFNAVKEVIRRHVGKKVLFYKNVRHSLEVTVKQRGGILRLWQLGDMSQPMIASHLGLTERQVAHALKEARKADPSIRTGHYPRKQPNKEWGVTEETSKLINRKLRPGEPKPLIRPEEMSDGNACMYIHGDPLKPGWQQCGHEGYPWCEWHRKHLGIPKKPTNPSENKSSVPASAWHGW